MPRSANLLRTEITEKAMHFFWEHGFDGASIDALVKSVGTTRFSLYQLFSDKEGLYTAVLNHYSETIVTAALAVMNTPDVGIDGIRNYFEFLISQAQSNNCLAHGCLMTNTMVTLGNRDVAVSEQVEHHFERVTAGIRQALTQVPPTNAAQLLIDDQALYLATFAQGLWLRARAGADAASLRAAYAAAIALLK
jgi:TetR/AcrR family transcriptional regulator, transcriptional repressor for nem operon